MVNIINNLTTELTQAITNLRQEYNSRMCIYSSVSKPFYNGMLIIDYVNDLECEVIYTDKKNELNISFLCRNNQYSTDIAKGVIREIAVDLFYR